MQKNEINVLLDQMCEQIEQVENFRQANISKSFLFNLARLVEQDEILDQVLNKMEENKPYLDEVLCNLVNFEEVKLSEKQMIKLVSITAKSPVYNEDEAIHCIMQSIDTKLSKTTIRKIARTLNDSADEFFNSYIDFLWDNIFKENLTDEEKEKARRLYDETKDWFFDEGWF